jgi:DNA polymerase-3 subunit delta'
MSALHALCGHEDARAALARAAANDELPGSLLIHGPVGVGKQRLGLWLAQLLVCEVPRHGEGPCGACTSCRLALRLEHPDIHWFFPIPRPKGASGPDKLAEALEEARATELAARRADPLRIPTPGEPVGLFLAQVQTIRRIAVARPAMGRRKVFLIGDAEALVPQESSPEAANALLKVLEEPPAETTFILTAASPEGLLPTLRSRLLPIRLRPLPEAVVAAFLMEHRGLDERTATRVARLGQGSIGRAVGFLPVDGDPGPLEALRSRAREYLAAIAAPTATQRLAAAHAVPPAGARGSFLDGLEFLALWLRDLAVVAAEPDAPIVNDDARDFLLGIARKFPRVSTAVPDALHLVDEAVTLASGNVNPQLILAWLLRGIRRAFDGGA